jgi:hypothetical protein
MSEMIPRPTEKCESGGRSTLYEMITEATAKIYAANAKAVCGALVLTGNKPTPTAQAPAAAKVMVRAVPRVRRPSSEPMNANAPNTAIHALYKRAFAYAVCPTPKLLRALVATLYPQDTALRR